MYGCESWTIKKAECRRIDAFELWCWRRLLRVPWTVRRSNQSILKEISPGCSLEGLMLKLKLQYFGHLMQRADSLSSVAQLCLTLCDPMDCSTPGLPVHHQLPEFTQTCPLSWWCHPTISILLSPSPPAFNLSASRSFQMSQLFASGGQSIGVSASTPVLPMNIQNWFP